MEKDITQKTLEDYNDVFADVLNVLLFDGKRLDSKRWGMNFRVPTFALVINTIRQFPDLR